MKQVSLDKIIDQKGGGGGGGGGEVRKKRKIYQISHIKNENGNVCHTVVFSQVF